MWRWLGFGEDSFRSRGVIRTGADFSMINRSNCDGAVFVFGVEFVGEGLGKGIVENGDGFTAGGGPYS